MGIFKLGGSLSLPGFSRIAFLLAVCAGLRVPLHASSIQVQLTPSLASPQTLGTTIVWTAAATDSNPGPVSYKFAWQMLGAGRYRVLRDFSTSNTLPWTPNVSEGTYQIQVIARDYLAQQFAVAVATFTVNPLAVNNLPAVVASSNPLVALFGAPSCATGSSLRIGYVLSGSTQMNYTDFRPCHPPATMNIYVAGMYPSSTYNMHYEVQTGSTIVPDTNVLSFTTGPIPQSAPMAVTSVPLPPTRQAAIHSGIVFTAYGIEPKSAPAFPAATDLNGRVLWYYPGSAQITHVVTGNPLVGTTILLDRGGPGTGTGPFGNNIQQQVVQEIDLAGNVIRETNADRVSEQLMAMGTDPIGNFHHEVSRMPNGDTLALGSVQRIYPAGTQGSPTPVDILGVMVIELDSNFQVVWYWNAFDHAGGGTQLDINRPATLGETCTAGMLGCPPVLLASSANDWLHTNSAQYQPDGSIVLSVRDQDWVIKIDYGNGHGTGNVLWRMGVDGDFTINSSDPYPWFSGQHDAEFQYGGTQVLTVFDDGNTRIMQNTSEHSRCQVYNVDEAHLQATPLLNADLGSFSVGLGSNQVLPNGNYFCNAGYIRPSVSPYQQGIEVTPYGTFAYTFQGNSTSYRAYRLAGLYNLAAFTSVPPITMTCPAKTGTVGTAYSSALTTAGGVPPYTFSITAGALPDGVTLDTNTGLLSGTPGTAGAFNFAAQAVDAIGADTGTAGCRITISQ